ncbi:MAG TPA: DUF2339 domain-containing protein [Flavobacteriales bacterium]
MEIWIFLLALLPIALLILMLMLVGRISTLSRDIRELREFMAHTMRGNAPSREAVAEPARPVVPPAPIRVGPPPVVPPAPVDPAPPPPIPIVEERGPLPVPPRLIDVPLPEQPKPIVVETPRPAPVRIIEPPLRPPAPPEPSFFERHPDLEKFIGENLINKIGIAVLVIGIGLLLQYAIGKGLISETGRTLIGLAAGGVLVALAHRLRNSFRAFSSVLVGGGIVVFYFTIAVAFREYQLIGQAAAFLIMVVVTGLAVALTLAYDRKELAVIALIGGFATPVLVSTGSGNFRVLFTYLLILDVGMLVLADFKKWHIINILSFGLTMVFFGGWVMVDYFRLDPRPVLPGFLFATAFFLVFLLMNLRYNLKHRKGFVALDHTLLLVNTAAYYGAGIHLLGDLPMRVTGLFTVLLGLFYLAVALYFHKREGIPRPLKLLLIGLVLTFISLAAPVQLEGSHITLFWAAEAVLLLWFAHRTKLLLVERASVAVTALMGFSLLMDLGVIYGSYDTVLMPLLNKGWITGMVSALSLALTTVLLRRGDVDLEILPTLKRRHWAVFTTLFGVLVLYAVNFLELRYQLGRAFNHHVVEMAELLWTLLYLLVLERVTRTGAPMYRKAIAVLLGCCAMAHITGYYGSSDMALWSAQNGEGGGFAPFHYVTLALMVIAVVRIAQLARSLLDRSSKAWSTYLWGMSIFLVILASQELDLAMMQVQGSGADLDAARRVGYPILWGLGSFAFMWYGMRMRLRTMRVIALTLFGLTLAKLFLFDLGSLSEGGRVAAFIVLGILLLVVSFMYQKLKVLLQADAPKENPTDVPLP